MHSGRLSPEEFTGLVNRLISRPTETEWIEFKENLAVPAEIGERISGLANSAALHQKPRAYLVWGIADQDHAVVGTNFDFHTTKGKGNEDLIPWLQRLLDPEPEMTLHEGRVDGYRVLVLDIHAASHAPIKFSGEEYVRVGSYTKKLRANVTLNKQLWRALDATPYELHVASDPMEPSELLRKIDYGSYFALQGWQVPATDDVLEQGVHPRSTGRRPDRAP